MGGERGLRQMAWYPWQPRCAGVALDSRFVADDRSIGDNYQRDDATYVISTNLSRANAPIAVIKG
jgi:hypothetical protein